jgi:hypothetical protein
MALATALCTAGNALVLGAQLILGLFVLWILGDAVYGADLYALGSVIVTHTLGAQSGIDHIDLITLGDGGIRTFRLTNITVDAFFGNY